MFETDQIPQYAYDAAEKHGIMKENIYLSAYCDKDREYLYSDTYVFATDKKLALIFGKIETESDAGHRVNRSFLENDYLEFDIEEIELLKLEEFLSGARLVAKQGNGENIFLCAFTNFRKNSISLFIKYFSKMKSGEIKSSDFKIDSDDDPKSNFCPKCGLRYPDKNRPICPHCMEKGSLYAKFWHFLKKYKHFIAAMLLCIVLSSAMAVIAPYFSGSFFYDKVLDESGSFYGQIMLVVSIVVLTNLLTKLFAILNGRVTARIGARVTFDLKKTIFSAIEKLSLGFFNGRQTGGLMNQVNSDANTIYSFMVDGVPYFLVNIVQVTVICVILFIMDPLLALLTLITVPLFFLVLKVLYKKSNRLYMRRYSDARSMHSVLSDVLSGMRVVKAFAKEDTEIDRFNTVSKKSSQSNRRVSIFNSHSYPAASVLLYLGNIIALGVGGWMIIKGYGSLTYGKLVTFIAYVNMIYSPMYFFADMVEWSADCTNALERLFEIKDTTPDITEKDNAVVLDDIRGHVEFKNVDFSYDKNRKIIDNVSFDIEAEHILGIVGHTGAGKSTIANLLMRLYDVQNGEILIDGINVKDLSFDSLYNNIAIVSQETYLFMGTILENIRYACPSASYSEVVHAAKCAGAHDFIVKLPDAYNTQIGAGYKELSGGERQRISIARAILRDPKILILDEATAAMDTQTEKLIQNALSVLTKGKTTIMIAHRLSTLRDADKLIVIEHGKVAESGTHSELLSKEDGVYKKLYDLQLEALKNAGIAE